MAKKRANGEGNIRKRKDGRWEGRYTAGYDSATGKRIIKNVLGKTQAEVKEPLIKSRLTAWHASRLHLFRQDAQLSLANREIGGAQSVHPDEKSDCATMRTRFNQCFLKEKLAQAMESIKDLDVARMDDYTVGTWLTSR